MTVKRDEKALLDLIRETIESNAREYFPVECPSGVKAELVSSAMRTTNPIYHFRLNPPGNHGPIKEVFAKNIPLEEDVRGGTPEYEALVALDANPLLRQMNVVIPRPLAYLKEEEVIITEMVHGEKLSSFLKKDNSFYMTKAHRAQLDALMERTGACLRAIHNTFSEAGTTTLPPETLPEILSTYHYLLDKGIVTTDEMSQMEDELQKAIDAVGETELPLTMQHGDFNAGNILVDHEQGTISVLDFTFSRKEVVYNDLGHFLATLEIINPYPRHPFYDYSNIGQLKEDFTKGYFREPTRPTSTEGLLISLYRIRSLVNHFKRRYDDYTRQNRRVYLTILKSIYRRKIARELELLEPQIKALA